MQFIYPDENQQFVYPVLSGGGSSSDIEKTEFRTISSGEATAKQLVLSQTPSAPSEVKVFAVEGSAQFYGDDYIVTGNVLDWSTLGLDTIGLVAGDRLIIDYKY
jgi:hypothetical protein